MKSDMLGIDDKKYERLKELITSNTVRGVNDMKRNDLIHLIRLMLEHIQSIDRTKMSNVVDLNEVEKSYIIGLIRDFGNDGQDKEEIESIQLKCGYIADETDRQEVTIPEGVIDERAYIQYVKSYEQISKHPKRFFQTSDSQTLDLFTFTHHIINKTNHLPVEEREEAVELCNFFKSKLAKLFILKKKAYKIAWTKGCDLGLLEPKSAELIEYFGRFFSVSEVHRIVKQDWGYDTTIHIIEKFKKQHIDKIKERQQDFQRDFSDVRLSYKKSRLEELSALYVQRKAIYQDNKHREDYKLLLSTIEQIRREVEGDRFTFDATIEVKVEDTIRSHINREILKKMILVDIVISRVAGKLGVNPNYLQSLLDTSYYKKLTGFYPIEDVEAEEVIYPSSVVYNFDELKKKHEQLKESEQKNKQLFSLSIDEKGLGDFKRKMLQSIREKKRMMNKSVARVETENR